jgi:hypothetical protein
MCEAHIALEQMLCEDAEQLAGGAQLKKRLNVDNPPDEFFPEATWQRCIVHWYRNVFNHVPSTKVREVAAMLKAIHAGEDLGAARQQVIPGLAY